jgi:hypothetical protein
MSEWNELGKLEEIKALLVLDKEGREVYSKIPKKYEKLREWAKEFNELIKNTFKELKAASRQVTIDYFNGKIAIVRCLEEHVIFLTSELIDMEKLCKKIREIEIAKKIEDVLRL